MVVLAAVVAALTLWQLVYPMHVKVAADAWLAELNVRKLNTLANVLLFVPWGFMGGWLGRKVIRGRELTIAVVLLNGVLISLLGETAQLWLIERHSSLVDLLANTLGTAIGAMAGYTLAKTATQRVTAIRRWLATRSQATRAAWVLLLVLLARAAPFDVSPEIDHLQEGAKAALRHGLPFADTITWLRETRPVTMMLGLPLELWRGGLNVLLFAAAGYVVARATRESFERRGDRTAPGPFVMVVVGLGLVLTEVMQWPIRSRIPDMTDAFCGALGVLVGVGLDQWRGALGLQRDSGAIPTDDDGGAAGPVDADPWDTAEP